MNPKTTGILFIVAAALAAFVYFYEIEGEQGRVDAEEATKRLFAGIEANSIESLTLKTSDSVPVEIRRIDDRWRITAPLDFPGDDFAIDGIASALASIQSESEIEDPRPPAVYGLDPDQPIVRFTADGADAALLTGNDTPVGSNVYASVADSEAVYIVASHRVGAFKKTFEDLREKRIARFDRSAVRRLQLKWSEGENDGGVEIEPKDDGWQLIAPIQGAADTKTVDDLLSSLSTLRATGFIDGPVPDAQAGLERPLFEARIELAADESGENDAEPRVVEVAIGGFADGVESRIVRGAEESLYTIALPQPGAFPTRLDPYRFRQLAQFSSLDAERIELGFLTDAGETIAITASNGDDGWTATPDGFQPGKLASMAIELSDLRAESILADELGAEELAAIGLDPPQASITVFGENDGPALAEIRLGTSRAAGIPAQISGNATVFQLVPGFAENVPINYDALNNRFLATAEPETNSELGAEPNAGDSFE